MMITSTEPNGRASPSDSSIPGVIVVWKVEQWGSGLLRRTKQSSTDILGQSGAESTLWKGPDGPSVHQVVATICCSSQSFIES